MNKENALVELAKTEQSIKLTDAGKIARLLV